MHEEFEKQLFDLKLHTKWLPFSSVDSKSLLSANHTLIQELFPNKTISKSNVSKDSLQVKHFPIQRCDIKPINMAADQSQFENMPMHSEWPEATVKKLLLLQTHYAKFREELLYSNIYEWNTIRKSFCQQSEIIPFDDYSLYDLDKSIQQFTDRSDKALQLTLMKGISEIMNEPAPREWIDLIQEMIAPPSRINNNLTARQLDLLQSFQLRRQEQSNTVLDKKRLCIEVDLSLEQVNTWLQSQLTGIGMVSVNQTSFADGINGILDSSISEEQQNQPSQSDASYLFDIFGGFGAGDLQFLRH